MFKDFTQFVPSSVCLLCDGCCRFREEKSSWRPRITEEEQQKAASPQPTKKVFNTEVLDVGQEIKTMPFSGAFVCFFLNPSSNACGIYHARPFECQLYPFLLVKQEHEVGIGVHLSCPYVQEHKDSLPFVQYVRYLKRVLTRPDIIDFLKRNPFLIGDYSSCPHELQVLFSLDLSPKNNR